MVVEEIYKTLVYEDENICIFKAKEIILVNEYGSYTLSRFDPIHIVSESRVSDDKVEVVYYFKEIRISIPNMCCRNCRNVYESEAPDGNEWTYCSYDNVMVFDYDYCEKWENCE